MTGERIDLNDMKREHMNNEARYVYFMAKVKVNQKQEFNGDWEMFRLYWRREIEKALKDIGEVRFFALAT
jgi:hypothetical protein